MTPLEKEIIVSIRKAIWAPLDDILDTVSPSMPKVKRSNLYATLKEKGINKVPQEKKREAKKFKEYALGFLHVDVTYLPKLEGKRNYLFVAIDRAIYPNLTFMRAGLVWRIMQKNMNPQDEIPKRKQELRSLQKKKKEKRDFKPNNEVLLEVSN